MGFYYPSIISLSLLILFYIIGTVILVKIWKRRSEDKSRALKMAPIFLLLYFAPIAEELWVAWNFGQLCKKDAGIFVTKTVEVEGYYDATANRFQIDKPVLPVTAASFDKRGYKFYEQSLRDKKGGANKVAHFEKVNGEWVGSVLDQPMARYYYRWLHSHKPTAYKIKSHEWVIEDFEQKVIIAQEKAYAREAYWFYIGLDRPTMFCPVFGNHGEKLTGGLYRLVLKPLK